MHHIIVSNQHKHIMYTSTLQLHQSPLFNDKCGTSKKQKRNFKLDRIISDHLKESSLPSAFLSYFSFWKKK